MTPQYDFPNELLEGVKPHLTPKQGTLPDKVAHLPKTRKNLLKWHELKGLSWRRISVELDVNPYYIYAFAKYGIEPTNPEVREKMGLKPLKPHCPRCHRPIKTGTPTARKPRTNWKKIANHLYQDLQDYTDVFYNGTAKKEYKEAKR
jgi:hypothetical protein